MAVSQAKVLDGLYTYMTANSTFNTNIGGTAVVAGRLWYAMAQQEETFPYVVYQVISAPDFDSMSHRGYELRVQFTVWQSQASGARSCASIMDDLRARLNRQKFAVTSHTQMTVWEDNSRGPTFDNDAWRMDADYIVAGFAS